MGWGDKTIDGAAIEHEERHTNFCEIYVDPEVKGDNPFINKLPANQELPKFADIKLSCHS